LVKPNLVDLETHFVLLKFRNRIFLDHLFYRLYDVKC